MIMGMFAGFVVICVIMLFSYGLSLAVTFWFISIPLLYLLLWATVKRERTRLDNMSPEEKARIDRDIARHWAHNAMLERAANPEEYDRRHN
jgi:hypothetical protein